MEILPNLALGPYVGLWPSVDCCLQLLISKGSTQEGEEGEEEESGKKIWKNQSLIL